MLPKRHLEQNPYGIEVADDDDLRAQDDGDADHKFHMPCFMSYQQHCKEHCRRAAERRDEKELLFGRSAFIRFGADFILYRDYDRDNGY